MIQPIRASAFRLRDRVQFKSPADKQRISPFTISFLEECAGAANVLLLLISTMRAPAEQAAAMYDKLSRGEVDQHAKPGRAVQQVALNGIERHDPRKITIDAMIAEIDKQGFAG